MEVDFLCLTCYFMVMNIRVLCLSYILSTHVIQTISVTTFRHFTLNFNIVHMYIIKLFTLCKYLNFKETFYVESIVLLHLN